MSKTFKPKAAASLGRHALAGASAAALGWAVSTAALALPGTPTIFDSSGGVGVAATFTPGTGTLTIDQNHERVVIDWTSFDIAAGETVTFVQDQANWIAFNRVDASTFTTIDGAINATGSVWIFSPAGMLIGDNASINVGSFVASLGIFDNFQANEAMGLSDPGVFVGFHPSIANENTLTVAAGATVTGTDFIILHGAHIDTAGSLNSSGGVGFINAEGANIDFSTASSSNIVLTNIGPSWEAGGRGTPTFDHTGTTTAAWVDLQFGQMFQANYQEIINLDGVITATGASSGLLNRPANTAIFVGGINSVTGLTGGRSVLLNVLGDINATAGEINLQATDIFIVDGATVDAGTAFKAFTYGDITIQGDITAAGQTTIHSQAQNATILIESTASIATSVGNIDISGNRDNALVQVFGELSAANTVNVRSKGDVYLGATAVLTGNSDDSVGATNFGVVVQAGLGYDFTLQTMTAIGAGDLTVASGAVIDASAVSNPARVFLGANNGDIDMAGSVAGSRVALMASNDIVMSGDITASESAQILAFSSATPGIGGSVTIDGSITADDFVSIWARYTGDVTIVGGSTIVSDADGVPTTNIFGTVEDMVFITADGTLEIESGATVDAGANEVRLTSYGTDTGSTPADAAMIISGDVSGEHISAYAYDGTIVINGNVTAGYDVDLYGGAVVITASGTVTGTGAPNADWPYSDDEEAGVFISAEDVAIAGNVYGDSIVIRVISVGQDMVIGGADGAATFGGYELGGEFNLSDAEFQQLHAPTVVIVSGIDNEDPLPLGNADMVVEDLTVNAAEVQTLVLLSSSQNTITIQGDLTPTLPGVVDLWIGGVRNNEDFVNQSGLIPGQINIIGSIGTAANPFGQVSMLATGDILMGSQDFISAAEADAGFDALLDGRNLTVDEGHIFIAADSLTLNSNGRIIQQNTAPDQGFGGLLIGEPSTGAELISSDPVLDGMVVGGPNQYTIALGTGPTKVQLFAVFTGVEPVEGRAVAENPWLLSSAIEDNVQYTINGCQFGGLSCGGASEVPQFETPTDIAVDDIEPVDEAAEEMTAEEEEAAEDQAASEDQDSELFRSLVAPGADRAYEQERIGEPITGSGNEDLWTGRGDGVRP